MGPEILLPYSQKPMTGACTEPDEPVHITSPWIFFIPSGFIGN
jgi:hypothetical protein